MVEPIRITSVNSDVQGMFFGIATDSFWSILLKAVDGMFMLSVSYVVFLPLALNDE
jgi:hypothetical protein